MHSSLTPDSIAGRLPKRSSSLLPVAFSALSSHSPRLQPKAPVIKLSFPWSFAACGFTYAVVVVVVARQRDGLGTSLHSRWLPLYRARHCRSRSDEGDESIVSVTSCVDFDVCYSFVNEVVFFFFRESLKQVASLACGVACMVFVTTTFLG